MDIDTNLIIPALRLFQFSSEAGQRPVGWIAPDGEAVGCVNTFQSTYELAQSASAARESLETHASRHLATADVPYAARRTQRRVRAPLTHPDPPRCLVSGTGLTRYDSANTTCAIRSPITPRTGGPATFT